MRSRGLVKEDHNRTSTFPRGYFVFGLRGSFGTGVRVQSGVDVLGIPVTRPFHRQGFGVNRVSLQDLGLLATEDGGRYQRPRSRDPRIFRPDLPPPGVSQVRNSQPKFFRTRYHVSPRLLTVSRYMRLSVPVVDHCSRLGKLGGGGVTYGTSLYVRTDKSLECRSELGVVSGKERSKRTKRGGSLV